MKQITLIPPSGYLKKIIGRAKTTTGIVALLLTAQWSNAQTWENVGSAETVSAGGTSFNNLAVDAAGNYYISYYDVSVGKGSVQKFDGTNWSYVGGSAGITTGTATFNALAYAADGSIYYSNQLGYPGSGMEVRKFSNGTWSQLPNVNSTGINSQAIAVSQDNTLFAFNGENSGTVKRFVNGAWEQVGNTGFSGGATFAEMVVASSGKVYLCNVANGFVQVYHHGTEAAEGNWVLTGGSTVGAASSSEQYTSDIAVDQNGTIYVAYVSNGAGGQLLNVKKYDGIGWAQVGAANFSAGRVQHVAIAVTSTGKPYVVASRWEDDDLLKNTAFRFDADSNNWIVFGDAYISSGQATYNDLAIDEANQYLVLTYSQGGAKVKRISIAENNTPPGSVCNNTEPGNNTGDLGCVSFTYMGETVSYTTVRGADGNIWLQQNLGSAAIATAMNDQDAYGDLYQWGRWADGHQKRDSETSDTVANPNNPRGAREVGGKFLISSPSWWDTRELTDTWRAENADAVTDTNGCDPCRALGEGWTLPTQDDWTTLINEEHITSAATGFASNLKLSATGYRSNTNGGFTFAGERGYYWSATTANTGGKYVYLSTSIANPSSGAPRGQGAAIRCVKLAPRIIEVTGVTISIQGSAQPVIATANGTLQLIANVFPAEANQGVTWSVTSGNAVATVNDNGLVTAVANGSVTVQATSVQDTTKTSSMIITVSNQPVLADCTFATLELTGFNADVVAEGTGANANAKATQPIDGANAYYAKDFVPQTPHSSGASAAAYGGGLPNNGLIASTATQGLNYQIASYGANNALVLRNSLSNTGTLTLATPKKAEKLYLAWVSAEGNNNVSVTVNFADGSSQVFAAQNASDWWNASPNASTVAVGTLGRVSVITTANWAPVNSFSGLNETQLFQKEFELSETNYNKSITSISFVKESSSNSATTTAILAASICETTVSDVVVETVVITTENNVDPAITTAGGTLQLMAAVTPATASQEVTWTVTSGNEFGTLSDTGLLTATANGTIVVRATSVQDPTKFVEITITVSGQQSSGITGFNYDIIANGVGNASASSQLGLDEVNSRALVSLDFQATADSPLPTYGLPVNGVINSVNTPGVTFQLENYSNKNALYLTPSYVTGSGNRASSGTLTFTAQNPGKVYILSAAAGGGSSNLPFSAIINFSDGTTQEASLQANDWYGNSGFAIKGIGRVNRANNNLEGDSENPRLYENSITIANQNFGKTITGITFSFTGDATAEYANEIRFAILSVTTTQGPATPVEDVLTVETSGNEPATITTNTGTLALNAYLNGDYASDVTWSIVDGGTGSASVNMYGQVTASGNGTITVRATLNSNTDVYGEIEVTITNQQAGYCDAYFINGCEPMSISAVTTTGGSTNLNNTASGCSNDNALTGYGNFTAQTVTATPGDVVNFTVDFTADSAYLSVWIDWNHDFIFSDSERVYFTGNAESTYRASFAVTVPQDAALTATRIRVKAVNGWEGSGPCGYNSFGEVEDYTFTITEGDSSPDSVTITTQGGVPASITTEDTTLQLVAVVAPVAASQEVVWTIIPGTGNATVDENGVVTPLANGTVTVRATSEEDPTVYTEIQITINLESLGTDTVTKNAFTIYPNPTGGDITIATSEPVKSVIIYNQLGQLVKTANTAVVSMLELPAGVYMVEVHFENNAKSVQKVIRK
jgi:uncharacterized protein (TIGR02145 family)